MSNKYFDSNGVELKQGDIFQYTSGKWKANLRLIERNGILGVLIPRKDQADKFVPLETFLKKHHVSRIGSIYDAK